jgi:predicted transcriptional regulator
MTKPANPITQRRRQLKLSEAEVATTIGVSHADYPKLETGAISLQDLTGNSTLR